MGNIDENIRWKFKLRGKLIFIGVIILIMQVIILLILSNFSVVDYIILKYFAYTKYNGTLHIDKFGYIFLVPLQILFGLTFLSYFQAALSNPGYIPPSISQRETPDIIQENLRKECTTCKTKWKPPRAYHCKVCDVCIFRVFLILNSDGSSLHLD